MYRQKKSYPILANRIAVTIINNILIIYLL